MLNGGYWEQLKNYYENEFKPSEFYDKSKIKEQVLQYAQEIIDGDASFLYADRPYDADSILTWIDDTLLMIDDEEEEGVTETIETFTHIKSYDTYSQEIAEFILIRDLDMFKNKIIDGDSEFIKEAVRLQWDEMLKLNPTIQDIFYF